MSRLLRTLGGLALILAGVAADAAPSPFDLTGPRLEVAVTRNGQTLPLEWVPNLAEGDRISVKLTLPSGQADQFRLVSAFLRGPIDRPPDDWFHDTVTGKSKAGDLSLVVPKGAQQLVLFALPVHQAGKKSIVSAVRKQPGTFVRAAQDLNQASLDRARLDTYLDMLFQVGREDPTAVNAASQALTRSLAIKLKTECLQQPAALQAACLTGDRETLLFADTHSSALADTLTGAPVDLAFQLSATPQAGYGTYSSYIGVVRDLFRLFGAFQSTQLQFVPALAKMGDGGVTLLLNTPLSFAKPASVMVIGLPAIEAAKPPPLQAAGDAPLLCGNVGAVLPVEGAPLVFATRYAHAMTLRLDGAGGAPVDIPVHADPRRGGFVLDKGLPDVGRGATVTGRLRGNWGFTPFDGPRFRLSDPRVQHWAAAPDASLVVGRTNSLTLKGDGGGCITRVEARIGDDAPQTVTWKQVGTDAISIDLPLTKAAPGPVTLTIAATGQATPVSLSVPALQEVGRIDALTFAAGDNEAVLTGSRLDQVRSVAIAGSEWQPGALTRATNTDRLMLQPRDPAAAAKLTEGARLNAEVTFTGNRHRTVTLTVAAARQTPVLLHRSVERPPHAGSLPIALGPDTMFAQDGRVTFAFRLDPATPLTGAETIEIGTVAGDAVTSIAQGKGYDLQDTTTGIVAFVPAETLGTAVHGALQFRIVRNGEASRWTALGTAVRLPDVQSVACLATAPAHCTVSGNRLFLIATIAAGTDGPAQAVPDGFTAGSVDVPLSARAMPGSLTLRLRDAPEATGTVTIPPKG
ncbi:hypothetical protein ACU5AX_11335 [Sphingomonas sp. XXL09]|uniref:hypothetical protein n=1 Tax=Sphingomonas sp. XXL09 TaxID=3457787 RepID=UPI00406BD9A8